MRQILESFRKFLLKFVKLLNKTLINFDKYIEMLENFFREFRKMLKKLKLYLANYKTHEKFLENLSNSFNNSVILKKICFH